MRSERPLFVHRLVPGPGGTDGSIPDDQTGRDSQSMADRRSACRFRPGMGRRAVQKIRLRCLCCEPPSEGSARGSALALKVNCSPEADETPVSLAPRRQSSDPDSLIRLQNNRRRACSRRDRGHSPHRHWGPIHAVQPRLHQPRRRREPLYGMRRLPPGSGPGS